VHLLLLELLVLSSKGVGGKGGVSVGGHACKCVCVYVYVYVCVCVCVCVVCVCACACMCVWCCTWLWHFMVCNVIRRSGTLRHYFLHIEVCLKVKGHRP
jgi:hypothetical protein